MKTLLQLFWEFFKTGLFSTGGGMATLPFLFKMSESHPEWFTVSQLSDMIAVSESTPGPIGVNMATFAGFNAAGITGSLFATLGLITPEIVVILIISRILAKFRDNKYVDAAFGFVRPCSVALIAAAGLLVAKLAFFSSSVTLKLQSILSSVNLKAVALAVILLILTRRVKKIKDLHPAVFIAASAIVGILFKF